MSKKELIRRYIVFTLGIIVSAFGVGMVACSDLGTSPISSLPYVLSINTPPTLGTYTFAVNMLMVVAQMLMLGRKGVKEKRMELLMQIPVSIVFGGFIDLSMLIFSQVPLNLYITKFMGLILGSAVLASGICMEVIADVTMLSGEFTVQIASRRLKKEFSTVKVAFDCSLVLMAIIASLLFSATINGVREGTVIAALITGPFVKLFSRYTKPIIRWFEAAKAESAEGAAGSVPTGKESPVIITIAREYGSGGHEIGEKIAKDLGIDFYDNQLIQLAAQVSNLSETEVKQHEQNINPNLLLRMITQDYEAPIERSLSPGDALFVATSKVVREIAAKGDCVIVGRCSDWILRDYPNCINLFVHADKEYKVRRAISQYGLTEAEAPQKVEQTNRNRAAHYEHYTGKHWTDSRNYHLVCDSSRIAPEQFCSMVEELYRAKKA